MPTPTDRIQEFLGKHGHGGHPQVTYHVAKSGSGVMVFMDCRQCGAGSGTSMSRHDAGALAWPEWAKAR